MWEEIQRALGRVEGKIDGMCKDQNRSHDYLVATSKRVGSLERWRSWIVGISIGAGAVGGLVIKVLS